MRKRSILMAALGAALVAGLLAPVSALAVGPTVSPAVVFTDGFEAASPSPRLTLDWTPETSAEPSPAYWGRVTANKHAGSYGLWCAGAASGSWVSTTAATLAGWTVGNEWTDFAGHYLNYTKAIANYDLPEMAGYYSANLDFWYVCPSLGSADYDAFNVRWQPAAGGTQDYRNGFPTTSTWSHLTFSLTAPTPEGAFRPVDLSRIPGILSFQFADNAGDRYESPFTGSGPTIDDISVSGFKFGPVGNLTAVENPDKTVTVAWTTPARSTALLAPAEERPVAYRVWRSPSDATPPVWTELTDARVSGTTFVDTAPLGGGARYIVQAWDPDLGPGYGEVDLTKTAYVYVHPPIATTSIDVTGGAPDGTGTYSALPTITLARSAADGRTEYRWDAAAAWLSSSDQTFTVPALAGTHTLEARSYNSAGDMESPAQSRTLVVQLPVTGPAPTTKIAVSGTKDATGAYYAPVITVTRSIADGTTVYWWDSGDVETTTSATFRVPAALGVHVLHAYSIANGANETVAASAVITVKTKPVVGLPAVATSTGSTYIRRYRSFYIKGTLAPAHTGSTTLRLYLERYSSGRYRPYKTYILTLPAGATSYKYRVVLSTLSNYRVRAYHWDSLHFATYSSYRSFTLHR